MKEQSIKKLKREVDQMPKSDKKKVLKQTLSEIERGDKIQERYNKLREE